MQTGTDNRTGDETRSGMKVARWAAVPTLLMAVLNAGAGPGSSGSDVPAAVAWTATVFGLAGLIAGIGLLRRVSWAVPAVAALAVVNVATGIVALVAGWEGGAVGLVLGLAALALIAPAFRRT